MHNLKYLLIHEFYCFLKYSIIQKKKKKEIDRSSTNKGSYERNHSAQLALFSEIRLPLMVIGLLLLQFGENWC